MANKGNPGSNSLARVLAKRMKVEGKTDLMLDFGSITAKGGLLTNTFPHEIPQSDYVVCRSVTLGPAGEELTKLESGDIVEIPESMQSIQAGDRVLVAWVQNDAVVIDIITSADAV